MNLTQHYGRRDKSRLYGSLLLLISLGVSSLQAQKNYTDYLPDYKINQPHLGIEKIEYTADELVIYLSIAVLNREYMRVYFFPPKDFEAWYLYDKEQDKTYSLRALHNLRFNDTLLHKQVTELVSHTIKDASQRYYLYQCELHFPLPASTTKTLELIEGQGQMYDFDHFNFFDIAIKTAQDPRLGTADEGKAYQASLRAKLLSKEGQKERLGGYQRPQILKPEYEDLPRNKEPHITQKLYFEKYDKKEFVCEYAEAYTASVRRALFSTALMNDLSAQFKLGIDLETELFQEEEVIYGLNVFWKGDTFSFHTCFTVIDDTIVTFDPITFEENLQVRPLITTQHPMVDGFIDATALSGFPRLQYKLASFDDNTVDKWDILEGRIGYDATNSLLFIAHKQGNYFLKRQVYGSEKRIEEIGYDLTTAKKIHEGSWSVTEPTRETIRVFDPDRFEEIEQIVETPGAWLKQGTWRYYKTNGKLEREERYKDGLKQ